MSILGGTIEAIDGRPAGRVTIAVPSGVGDIGETLRELGLHAEPAGAGAVSHPSVSAAGIP